MIKTYLTLLILLISISSLAQNKDEILYNLVVKNDTKNSIKLISEKADVNYVMKTGWVKVNILITAINNVNV